MDNILTNKIGVFLQKEKPTDQEIKDAATMLLQLEPQRARAIYNTAQVRPQAMLPWIRTDLKKHYAIRKRGLTKQQVKPFNQAVVKKVDEQLAVRPETVKVEKASAVVVEKGVRKRRDDHDLLPEPIKKLWEQNADRWKKMRQLRQQLAIMIERPDYQPCDGNELCNVLREAEDDLVKAYEKYDSYLIGDKVDSKAYWDNAKAVTNARSAITRNLKADPMTDKHRQKLQDAVNTLVALKQEMLPATIEKLKAAGVTIPEQDA